MRTHPLQEKPMLRFPRLLCGLLPLLIALLAGCTRLDPPGAHQPLVVGLLADSLFQKSGDSESMEGFSRDLIKLFARELGVEMKLVVAPDHPALLDMLHNRTIHMAASLPFRSDDPTVIYSPPLRETRQVIVHHASSRPISTLDKLAGREIALLTGAPQATALRALQINPAPLLIELGGSDELALLADVAQRRHELVATDELHFAIAANAHPDIEVAIELPDKLYCGWGFPASNGELLLRATHFIEALRADGTLRQLNDRYFGHLKRMDSRDIGVFISHVRGRLSHYRHMFQEAQEITGIDWRLLAALGYQESKWDPLATSPTGVRGMMMLTEDTADRLGVKNRLDAHESILAGAKYLAMLMDELPNEIRQPDRLWLALAAYNLGMGHLNGGRHFAPGLKRDPNLWVDMKEVLPLLSRPEYYERLKSGRARGGEAVIMVENIRNYHDALSRFEPSYTSPRLGFDEKPRLDTARKSWNKSARAG
jgi:membrane-bound lytic murein transglycosylase F